MKAKEYSRKVTSSSRPWTWRRGMIRYNVRYSVYMDLYLQSLPIYMFKRCMLRRDIDAGPGKLPSSRLVKQSCTSPYGRLKNNLSMARRRVSMSTLTSLGTWRYSPG